ncbi:UvrD-helicase domain-containing protein [Alkalithermobacter paradoxus]|uniref:UvrD/REP helicase n=1 Tax=Alkalithermobacter paradoxus TaxID=29349 RepID=A0A1V4IAZ0_9FIRM|nr:UvrD/REP helicase [[Clostridium] thermoalcaliphilum]
MKIYSTNIVSDLDSLRIKSSERDFYKHFSNKLDGVSISKVVPVEGISLDLMYMEDNNILFIKFMDTSEDTYSILEEDLLEVMEEEYENLVQGIKKFNLNIKYNIVYIMPYVSIERYLGFEYFIKNHIIDKNTYKNMIANLDVLKGYFKGRNEESVLNLFRFYICPEYHTIKKEGKSRVINKDFKRISFWHQNYEYTGLFLDSFQLSKLNSIKYGNTVFVGGAGSGKTTILLSRAIKLSKLYNKDRFLFITYNKQLMNNVKNEMSILRRDSNNIDIYNFHGFIIRLAKQFNLVIDYAKLKENFEKHFKNIFLQVKNYLKDKVIYKGIFIDEGEKFDHEQLEFISSLLYDKKKILNISIDRSKKTSSNSDWSMPPWEHIDIDEYTEMNYNYRQTRSISNFLNSFSYTITDYTTKRDLVLPQGYYSKTHSLRNEGDKVQIIKVDHIEEKIEAIIWEIKYLVNQKGLSYSDIAVIYPFSNRKLKNGNVIYFQYILRKSLEENNIPYVYANDELTNLNDKIGVTISNIYLANNLEYKAVVFCEIEMLYDHKINSACSNSKIGNFISNLNIVYTGLTRATDYLTIVTTLEKEESDIMGLLINSLDNNNCREY